MPNPQHLSPGSICMPTGANSMRVPVSAAVKMMLACTCASAAIACEQNATNSTAPTTPGTPPVTRRVAQGLRATPGGVDILTYHGSPARTGWNRHETQLTLANVRPETFGQVAAAHEVE